MDDAEAFDYYDDPTKREPASGMPRRRSGRPLSQHLPVRFPRETICQVERFATVDGVTVSAWIRTAVDQTLHRRDSFEPASR
jgi:hypothetical protein